MPRMGLKAPVFQGRPGVIEGPAAACAPSSRCTGSSNPSASGPPCPKRADWVIRHPYAGSRARRMLLDAAEGGRGDGQAVDTLVGIVKSGAKPVGECSANRG